MFDFLLRNGGHQVNIVYDARLHPGVIIKVGSTLLTGRKEDVEWPATESVEPLGNTELNSPTNQQEK